MFPGFYSSTIQIAESSKRRKMRRRSKKIDPEVNILSSLEAVREEVNICLSYYLSRSA